MEKLLITLRYIIKTGSDAYFINLASNLIKELKTYDERERELVDNKFNTMSREQIAMWLCKNCFIESADCDCDNCIYNCCNQ